MSEPVLFTGPSLPPSEAERLIDARVLPPVSQGDLYAVARRGPPVIGIVDGYFDVVPSVWHKEILWALSRGIHVLGAASLGALRAAELEMFGMVGVGEVFEAFRDGELEDDDEVTVAHGPPETGYLNLSEAMVNIRATLAAALDGGVLDAESTDRLIGLAKATHYRQRGWDRLLREARAADLPGAALDDLERWLPSGRVDRKRRDAEAMVVRMRELADAPPFEATFRFQHTQPWEALRAAVDGRGLEHVTGDAAAQHDALLDELRLRPDRYHAAEAAALLRILSSEVSERLGVAVAGLPAVGESELRPLLDQELSPARARRLLEESSVATIVRESVAPYLPSAMCDELRLRGQHADLERRARNKQRELAARGLQNPTLADAGLDEEGLWRWFFVDLHDRPVPEDLDTYARDLGYDGIGSLRRAALRERVYLRCRDTKKTRQSV